MSRVELFEAIRRDARLEELSIRALAERHGVHRRTVRQVAAHVSGDMRKGPHGGGRARDEIVRHTLRTERLDFAKRLGLRMPEEVAPNGEGTPGVPGGVRRRNALLQHGRGKRMRSWNLGVPHSAQRVPHHGPRIGDGRQGPQRGFRRPGKAPRRRLGPWRHGSGSTWRLRAFWPGRIAMSAHEETDRTRPGYPGFRLERRHLVSREPLPPLLALLLARSVSREHRRAQ